MISRRAGELIAAGKSYAGKMPALHLPRWGERRMGDLGGGGASQRYGDMFFFAGLYFIRIFALSFHEMSDK